MAETKLVLEDYGFPVDPTPTRKTSNPGTIEHGSPLGPYIPDPPPPYSPPPQLQPQERG